MTPPWGVKNFKNPQNSIPVKKINSFQIFKGYLLICARIIFPKKLVANLK